MCAYCDDTLSYDGIMETEVGRAALVLDRLCPGWENKINLSYLDIYSVQRCVLGQVFKDQATGQVPCRCGCGENEVDDSGYSWAVRTHRCELQTFLNAGVFSAGSAQKYWVNEIEARRARPEVDANIQMDAAFRGTKKDYAAVA